MPDHVSLWGSLLKFRREFDQYINLRPVRLFEGVPCPLAGRKPGDIDYFVVRENTEGEYTNARRRDVRGHRARDRDPGVGVLAPSAPTACCKYAFELAQHAAAQAPDRGHQEQRHRDQHAVVGRRAPKRSASDYPDVTVDKQHIDILRARFVLQPQRFDVVVASNLFGDILSDLGPGDAPAPSAWRRRANLNPERKFPSLFEPVHGSAPDIYGQNIANPIAMIWSGALMLDFLTQGQGAGRAAHDAIVAAIEPCCAQGPRTRRPGRQRIHHRDVGQAIADACRSEDI